MNKNHRKGLKSEKEILKTLKVNVTNQEMVGGLGGFNIFTIFIWCEANLLLNLYHSACGAHFKELNSWMIFLSEMC
jgi:hypothetical protein